MADGCIIDSKPQHRVVVLDLKYGDIAHVESFKNFLKSGHKITKVFKKKTYNAKIQVGSERLATVLLQRYGIGPRKSFTAQVSGELALNRHFWRGVIDGDGHIKLCKHRQSMMPKFELVGSRALLTQFLDFAQFNGLITIASPKLNKDKNIWRLALSGNGIGRIIAMLYANASTVLARKAITAAAITTHTDPIEIEKRRLNSCNAGFTTASKKTPEQRKIEMARISAIRWATAR